MQALSKNGEYIGQRYVRLLHVPRAEMEEQVRLGTLAIPGAAAKLRSRMMRSQQRNNAVYMTTGPVQLMPTVMQGGRPVMATIGPHGGPGPSAAMGAPYTQPGGPGQLSIDSRLWWVLVRVYEQKQGSTRKAAKPKRPIHITDFKAGHAWFLYGYEVYGDQCDLF